MRNHIPDLFSTSTFQPEDLAIMQRAFDEACRRIGDPVVESRMQMAQVIFQVYSAGERYQENLVASALSAVR